MQIIIKEAFKNPKKAKRILEPESEKKMRSCVKLSASKKELHIKIDAKDINAARASANTYLRLINMMKKIGGI